MTTGPAEDRNPLLDAALADTPLTAALAYAKLGWPVFPVYEPFRRHPDDTRLYCACGGRGSCKPAKHPRTPNGLLDATTDVDQLRRWWKRWPNANVAIRTGLDASGLLVVDVDPRSGGLTSLAALSQLAATPAALAAWEAETADEPPSTWTQLPDIPARAAVVTGSNGFHYYLAHPDARIKSKDAAFGQDLPGVDIKARGGYVIAPPSRHITGGAYRWLRATTGTAPIIDPTPEWMTTMLAVPIEAAPDPDPDPGPARATDRPRYATGRGRLYVKACIEAIFRELAGVKANRNDASNYAGWRIGWLIRLYPEMELNQARLVADLVRTAKGLTGDHPFTEEEARTAVDQGVTAGLAGAAQSSAKVPLRHDDPRRPADNQGRRT